MTFQRCLWRAVRVKLPVFAGIAMLAVSYLGVGGQGHLPTERVNDPDAVCQTLPSFYAEGACDSNPNT